MTAEAKTGTISHLRGFTSDKPSGAHMRHVRTALLLALAVSAFAACKKKGGGYMTEPAAAAAR